MATKIGALFLRILRDPKTIIAGVILGFVNGFYLRDFSHSLKPIADIYVSLLSMCLLPILVSALVRGIGQMLRHPNTKELFSRMAVIYVIGLIVPAAVTIVVAVAVPPGRDGLLNWVNFFLDEREIDFDAAGLITHEGPWVF